MTDLFIHVWEDEDGKPLICEHKPIIGNIHDAIIEYNEQEQQCSLPYQRTLKLDIYKNTWEVMNIQNEIQKIEDEKEKERLEDLQYGTYEQQVREQYVSTRGVFNHVY